jgi:probable FeS assembly SUF system protein SufT
MYGSPSVDLKRDCEVTQIPAGTSVVLPMGTPVDITQTLGGSFTVRALAGGLYRVMAKDADALGIMPETDTKPLSQSTAGPVGQDAVLSVLRNCYDPEIPVNIVDLGLVYDTQITALPNGKSAVAVKMTLTAPGCGMGGAIAGDAREKLLNLPGVEEAAVDIVWEPQWHHSMITEQGRRILGLD